MPQRPAAKRRETELVIAPCRKYSDGAWADFEDTVTPEQRVELLWPGVSPLSLWAFPEDLERLVLGHALIELCGAQETPVLEKRNGDSFSLAPRPLPDNGPAHAPRALPAERVLTAMELFIGSDGRWDATGCFHRAAVYDTRSEVFLHKTEDIGRHNCIDRLAGWSLTEGRPLDGQVLFVSARATASLVAKAIRAGFAGMVSRSAVTTSGIALARESGLSLAGFARTARFTVFTDAKELFMGAEVAGDDASAASPQESA